MRNTAKFFLVCFVLIFVLSLLPNPREVRAERGSDYVVNASTDQEDLNPGDGNCNIGNGNCTLRAAIQEANAYIGINKISFTVTLLTISNALPALTDSSGGTTIYGADSVYILTTSTADIFTIDSNNNKIQGLRIAGYSGIGGNGIVINGDYNTIGVDGDSVNDSTELNYIYNNNKNGILINSGGDYNILAGNKIGINPSTSTAGSNLLNGIDVKGSSNRIGVLGNGISDSLEGNTITNSGTNGIAIINSNNVIAGNLIYSNGDNGIIVSGAFQTKIGTDGNGSADAAEANHIHNNTEYGVYIYESDSTIIAGNKIGTNGDGSSASGNGYGGIYAYDGYGTVIGTDGAGSGAYAEGNLISGNLPGNIFLANSESCTIAGNKIGTDISGTLRLGGNFGIKIDNSTFSTIGTNGNGTGDTNEGNLISGNGDGIYLLNGSNNITIAGNRIGINASGTAVLYNSMNGILVIGAHDNLIGTNANGISDSYERNIISGNTESGILLKGDRNRVSGNYIGLDATGLYSITNQDFGVEIVDGFTNYIGSNGDSIRDSIEGNVISGNTDGGILIKQTNDPIVPYGTRVYGNKIGTNANGSSPIPNLGAAIKIDGAGDNQIGYTPNLGNLIAYHDPNPGVVFIDNDAPYATGNTFLGNSMYQNSIGIDLEGNGVTLNDNTDGDSGPNELQNYPVLISAASTGTSISVILSLNSKPDKSYAIDFYWSPSCNSTGYCEGKQYLGNTSIITENDGNYSGQVAIEASIIDPGYITATVTYAGSTSEFSQCIELEIENGYKYIYLPLILR